MRGNNNNNNGEQKSGGTGGNSVGPNVKNDSLKHVPCKFFRQGNCTAGDTCPFLHQTGTNEPCKYFLKGNCKFGNKCALVHGTGGHRSRRRAASSTNNKSGGNNNSGGGNGRQSGNNANSRGANNTSQSNRGQQNASAERNTTTDHTRPAIHRTSSHPLNIGTGNATQHLRSPTTSTAMPSLSPGLLSNTLGGNGNDVLNNVYSTSLGNRGFELGLSDPYRTLDTTPTSYTFPDISSALSPVGGNSTSHETSNSNTMNIPGRTSGAMSLMNGAGSLPYDASPLHAARRLQHSASFSGLHSGGLGGISLGLALPSFSSSTEFSTSSFGGERSVLLSLSHDARGYESSLISSSYPRLAQRRSAHLLNVPDGMEKKEGSRGSTAEVSVDDDRADELGYDDFQPELFPSSLDELLTPSELEKRYRREPNNLSSSASRPSPLLDGPLSLSHFKEPLRSQTPRQQSWRSSTMNSVPSFERGFTMSVPNYDTDLYAGGHTMGLSVDDGPVSPGGWSASDGFQPFDSAASSLATTSSTNLTAAAMATRTVGGPVTAASTPGAEKRFSFNLDDDVTFRMDDLSESTSPNNLLEPILFSQTLPELSSRRSTMTNSTNRNMTDGLTFRLANLRLGAQDRSTATTEDNR